VRTMTSDIFWKPARRVTLARLKDDTKMGDVVPGDPDLKDLSQVSRSEWRSAQSSQVNTLSLRPGELEIGLLPSGRHFLDDSVKNDITSYSRPSGSHSDYSHIIRCVAPSARYVV